MKKNAFTLIELLAVITIMSIITMIATPKVINLVDNSKKVKYITDAKDIAVKANYMYGLPKYESYFKDGKIKLSDIEGIDIDKDSFGYTYDKENSYIEIKEDKTSEIPTKEINIYIKSCSTDNNGCYYICNENSNDLSASSVKPFC